MDVNTDFACKFATLFLVFALVFIYVQHITPNGIVRNTKALDLTLFCSKMVEEEGDETAAAYVRTVCNATVM